MPDPNRPPAARPAQPQRPPAPPPKATPPAEARPELPADLPLSAKELKALGAYRSAHPGGSRQLKINLMCAAVLAFFPLAGALYCAVDALTGPPDRGIGWAAVGFGGLGLVPALIGLFAARRLFWQAFLFDNGFVVVRGRTYVVRWPDVRSVFLGGLNHLRDVTVIFQDGKQFKVDNSFKKYDALADAINTNVTRLVVARADVALAKGDAFAFGKLKLSRDGVEEGGKSLPWADVACLAIEGRVSGNLAYSVLVVREKDEDADEGDDLAAGGQWGTAKRITMFPNFDACLEIACRYTKLATPK